MANKVKFGLKNVHYAMEKATGYETPVAIPGAVSLSLDPQGELYKFFADNIEYFSTDVNNGYEGDLEMALIPDHFRIAALGETKDANDVMVENAEAISKKFAFGFQFEGDAKATRYWLYHCTATRTNVAGNTKEETIEVQTETLTISATPGEDGVVRGKTTESTPTATYDGWFDEVYIPQPATTGGATTGGATTGG